MVLCKADPIAPSPLMAASTVWEAKIEALKKRKLVAPTSLTAFKAAHMGSGQWLVVVCPVMAWIGFELLSYSLRTPAMLEISSPLSLAWEFFEVCFFS